jgi:hypothetical protein
MQTSTAPNGAVFLLTGTRHPARRCPVSKTFPGATFMDETPNAQASKKTMRDMKEAVDKVIDDKKKEPIGTKETEEKVSDDLMDAAKKATNK